MLAKGLKFAFGDRSDFFKGLVLGHYPRKRETIDELNRFFDKADCYFEKTPFQQYQEQSKLKGEMIFVHGLVDYVRIHLLYWRYRSNRLALVTILAIKQYQLETGQLPVSLLQLTDLGYIDKVSMDPFSDKPLIYKTTKDDFILYSVGADFKDDGGKIEYRDNGKVNQWHGNDYIFWPTRKKTK